MDLPRVLLIDDDEVIFFSFKTFLDEKKYHFDYTKNGKEGLSYLVKHDPQLIIADYKMPEMTGLEFLKAAKIIKPDVPIIIISAFGDLTTKRLFQKEGAFEFIEKPFDIHHILTIVEEAIASTSLSQGRYTRTPFIGNAPSIQQLFSHLDTIKNTDVTVLIEGESGTGKDVVSAYIHYTGSRAEGPFVSINCAAIPENLIESELFGYEKGAFTGADDQKKGKFEAAKGGTLFLDEIAELPLALQAKLLRVLQNKTVERIGGTKLVSIDARIIAATNQSLKKMCHEGRFREDLYYRLSTFPVYIPALKDRGDDIVLIAEHLLNKYAKEFKKPLKKLSKCAQKLLMRYSWPGNVREMQNVLSRLTILENRTLITDDILQAFIPNDMIPPIAEDMEYLAQFSEKELLKIHANETFKLCNFNKSETAKRLGINYRTLIKRLEG